MNAVEPLLRHFAHLEDPRVARTREHSLESILFIAICAVIAGEENWVGIEDYAEDNIEFFRQFLDLPHGIPSHDTLGRVFAALDTQAFAEGFMRWMHVLNETLATRGDTVAIDGKTMRRTLDKANKKSAIHLVSAFACSNRLVLGQVKVDDKSNEITAIPELLRQLALTGCLVTLDAMGCQKHIAKDITLAGADYILALKGNHGDLHRDVMDYFNYVDSGQVKNEGVHQHQDVDAGHGRIEDRLVQAVSSTWHPDQEKWPQLKAFVRVISERHIGQECTKEVRYFLSSLPADQVKRLAQGIRDHWSIENELHWCLDMAFGEDYQRMREGDAAPNMAVLNKIALNLLRKEASFKGGIKRKRHKAARGHEYLLKVLASAAGLG